MSIQGDLNRLSRKVTKTISELRQRVNSGSGRSGLARGTIGGIILNVKNNSGAQINLFSCVKIVDPASALVLPTIELPTVEDSTEETIYGSLLQTLKDNEVGFIQLSGRAIFLLQSGDSDVKLGEIIYPLTNGKVGNKASTDLTVVGDGIGRSLTKEVSDTNLLEVNLVAPGGTSSGFLVVRVTTTTSITLSGVQTVDDVLLNVDDLVLVRHGVLLGVYKVKSAAWERYDPQPVISAIRSGTLFGGILAFDQDGSSSWILAGAVFK